MKKLLSLLLSLCLVGTLAACSTPTSSSEGMKAGTYSVSAEGFHGEIKLDVTVDAEKITDIVVVEHTETEGIGAAALPVLVDNVLKYQTIGVDSISGATVTSDAFKTAMKEALTQAGADIEKMSASVEVDSSDVVTLDTDVVVVGGGAAGLASAIEAAEAGAKVVLIEKQEMLGGSTILSGGCFLRSATETENSENGSLQSDALVEFLMERANQNADETIVRSVVESSQDTVQWMLDSGYQVGTVYYPVEKDVIVVTEWGSGATLISTLQSRAEEAGVEIMTSTAAESLIMNDGTVSGVNAASKTGTVTINAKSVVLATGGFNMNLDKVRENTTLADVLLMTAASGNVGDGIDMAKEAGAKISFKGAGLNSAWQTTSDYVNNNVPDLPPCLMISDLGERVLNERQFYSLISNDMIKSGRSVFYLIFDAEHALPDMDAEVEKGVAMKAETLEDIITLTGVDADNFNATIARYNELKGKEDVDFGKDINYMTGMETGPFYVLKCVPSALGSFGGLSIDLNSQVIDEAGNPVANLYAAGEVANTDFFGEVYPVSGSCIQHAVTTGRVAGVSAAENAK